MSAGGGSPEIGIVIYPGVQLAAVLGLTDLFKIASQFAAKTRSNGQGPPLRVTHWGLGGSGEVGCVYCSEPRAAPRPTVLVLPPTLTDLPDAQSSAGIALWLHDQHARGVALASICSGIFLVAQTGLLDGRIVSTHRSCAQALMDRFPRVAVAFDERMIEQAGILTAGGFMAWVDVGLVLVERQLGDAVRAQTAQFVLSDTAVAQKPYLPSFAPPLSHSDLAIQKAQTLVHVRDGRDVSLGEMAAVARLERRTFLRRFASATGMTPIEYCRAVRIARARELLEAGGMPVKEIAAALGYGDAGTFARAFRRASGMPPAAYRRERGRREDAPIPAHRLTMSPRLR